MGGLLFISVFITGAMNFGNFDNFEGQARSSMLRAIGGMVLIVVGQFIRGIGARGLAGSGVVLDPKQAREDLKPYSTIDTHGPNWGRSRAWSGILASGLSKQNIFDAMAKRHCYSTLDRNCLLRFSVNEATMGDIITEPVKEVKVSVRVGDPDKGDLIAKIELFEDGAVVNTNEPKQENWCWNPKRTPEPGKPYYFAKVTQADSNRLWSALVWVMVGEK